MYIEQYFFALHSQKSNQTCAGPSLPKKRKAGVVVKLQCQNSPEKERKGCG